MRIVHFVTGLSRANGVTVFVENLVRELNDLGHEAMIAMPASAKVDFHSIDVAHLHGLWIPWLHKQSAWARRERKKTVWSPHGMLTPWAMRNHWWKKLPSWYLYQKSDLLMASALHVTAQSEVADVRRYGLKNELIMAPLGVNVNAYGIRRCQAKRDKRILFVGRIHRIKGLERLLRAFAATRQDGWMLMLVGPDQENHLQALWRLAAELGVHRFVQFAGPLYGDALTNAYGSADCFVLPSFTENFGSVVVEALASCVPVIATKGTPWEDLNRYNCGWWVENSEDGIKIALREVMGMSDEERVRMGVRGRKLVEGKFTWSAVAKRMIEGYKCVLKGEWGK